MAELVFAVVPVAAKVLQGCLDTYKLFTEAKELSNESQSLIWKFRIQQTRLQIWGEEWGLLASSSHRSTRTAEDDDGENPLVLETLVRISDILGGYKQLSQRYGLTLVSDDPQYRRPVGHDTQESAEKYQGSTDASLPARSARVTITRSRISSPPNLTRIRPKIYSCRKTGPRLPRFSPSSAGLSRTGRSWRPLLST